jgi:hypothetical protein
MSAYCTQADVMSAAGRFGTLTAAEVTACASAITQAQAWVEKATGTFFDQKHLKVVTQTVRVRQKRIFLPAPVVSIDGNTITENGNVLTLGTDFVLYQPSSGPGWLEKLAANIGLQGWMGMSSADGPAWDNTQQCIVVEGQFGYATVPADITKLTAWVAARFLGWVTVSFTNGDGVTKAVLNLDVPEWAKSTIAMRSLSPLDQQYFGISPLA